jgi:hypothetical protein
MELVKLLHSKNNCLVNFLNDSKKFLLRAQEADFSGLQSFHDRREATLKAIGLFDRKIADTIGYLSTVDKSPLLIETIRRMQDAQDQTIQTILATDQVIIGLIEEEKKQLQKELASTDKSSQLVQKFKSTWINESGEKLDEKL